MSERTITWDVPTRIIHWVLAALIVANLFVVEGDDSIAHQWIGYAAAFMVMVRGVWGVIGGEPSRFRSFPLAPSELMAFARGFFTLSPKKDYPGHNPIASWTYIGIWAIVIALGVSGWMMTLDAFWGNEILEETHEVFTKVLQLLILGHFVGMTLDAVKYKRKTWFAMIRGWR